MKRIVIVSDFHNGSEAGLTTTPQNETQRQLLARYKDCIKHFGTRPDILILNGDAVDGDQSRGGGDEDNAILHFQIGQACDLVEMWKPKRAIVISGTPYHVGGTVIECEQVLTTMLRKAGIRAEFSRKLTLLVNGWFKLQCRHHIGSSGVPHGRFTAQNRSRIWGLLNAAETGERPPHLSVFSHVHYYTFSEDGASSVCTSPAWQAQGGRYGLEKCDGRVDLGAIQLTVGDTEDESWELDRRLYPANVVNRTVRG